MKSLRRRRRGEEEGEGVAHRAQHDLCSIGMSWRACLGSLRLCFFSFFGIPQIFAQLIKKSNRSLAKPKLGKRTLRRPFTVAPAPLRKLPLTQLN